MIGKIIKIGNSQGITIPKKFLEEAGLNGLVEVKLKGKQIIIEAKKKPREGWEASFKQMHVHGDDKPLIKNISNKFDKEEWEW